MAGLRGRGEPTSPSKILIEESIVQRRSQVMFEKGSGSPRGPRQAGPWATGMGRPHGYTLPCHSGN